MNIIYYVLLLKRHLSSRPGARHNKNFVYGTLFRILRVIYKFSTKCNNSMKKRSQQPKTATCTGTGILLLVKMLQFTADYNDSNVLCIFF